MNSVKRKCVKRSLQPARNKYMQTSGTSCWEKPTQIPQHQRQVNNEITDG